MPAGPSFATPRERFAYQAAEYRFPYHWLPSTDTRGSNIGRVLSWGLEYLAVLECTRDLTLRGSPARVLDVGCGDGRLAHELLSAQIDEVVGVDLVEQAIAFARAFNTMHGSRARFCCEPIASLPESGFDVAVAMEVLEHVEDSAVAPFVEAIWRRVRRGGCLVVSVPTMNVPLDAKHERHYTEQLLRTHLSPHFEIDVVHYVHRVSTLTEWLRRISTNRLFTLEAPRLTRAVLSSYHRFARDARVDDGAHLVAGCHRVSAEP